MSIMSLISQNEYAKRRGVSREAVRQHVVAGRISLIDGKIDPVVADAQWTANVRNPKAAFVRPKQLIEHRPIQNDPSPDIDIAKTVYALQLARAKRETHEANLAEMKERQRAGELVELAQVHLAYTTLAAQLRAALERIPDKLAPRLAAETDEHAVHALLLTELDQTLIDMGQSAEQLPVKLTDASNP